MILHEDEHCVIIRDKRKRAHAHYQCLPKRHIKNFSWLNMKRKEDLALLRHMENMAFKFLIKNHRDKMKEGQFRMGFHGPLANS